jgi:hypothetical protein
MATVDLYRMRKVGTQALPGVRMTAAETALSEGAGVEQERAQKFDQVTRLGQRVTLLGQELGVEKADTLAWETQKANTLKALQTSNDLDQWTATALYDPKTGALLTKGPATLGITQKVLDDFDKKSGEIAQGLSNDTQRIAFAKQRQQQRLSIQVTLDRHADSEMQKYRADELNSFVTNQRANAVANANDPRIVAVNLHTAEDAINLHAPELGLGPEKQQELIEATRTSTHAGVIMALLSQQQVKKAQAYFDHAKDEITVGDTRAILEKQLDVAGTKQQGLDASTKIWDQLGPKGENDPINIDKMEDAARKQFANDPDALEATMHFLRERKSATDAGRKDREEAQLGGLWSKVAAGAGLAEVSRDPAYLAAPGRVQLQVNDYILGRAEREASRAYAQEGRAYTAAQRLEHEKEQKGWSRYWELSDPKTLNATSENALQAMRGELGDEHVNRLLAGKRQLQKGDDKVRAATIDDDLFKTIASGAGLHPYETKGKTEAQNAELGQLRAAVEARIDQEQQAKGKELTRSEKEAVMHEMVDKKVYLNVWGRDPQTIAALVTNPENRAIAYVPIKDIHPNKLTQYLNYARSLGAAQQRMSDADLQQRYSDRFQHAEALRLLGAKDEEIAAAIRGQ